MGSTHMGHVLSLLLGKCLMLGVQNNLQNLMNKKWCILLLQSFHGMPALLATYWLQRAGPFPPKVQKPGNYTFKSSLPRTSVNITGHTTTLLFTKAIIIPEPYKKCN